MGRRDFLFASFSALHILSLPMRGKTMENTTMENKIIQGHDPSMPWKAQVWQVFLHCTTSGFSQWECRRYPAVWSETTMQLVEPALTKHIVPLITYRVLSWKPTQSDIQNEQYLILNNGLVIAQNPLLPEINTLSRRTGILLSSGTHNTYTYIWNISKENTQTFFLTFKQK